MVCKRLAINITRERYDAVLFDLDGAVTKLQRSMPPSGRGSSMNYKRNSPA
jgi:hypothetical protein